MMIPLNAHIEITFGCNNRCKFCFKQVLDLKRPKFMTYEHATEISRKLQNKMRLIKFSLRGEPLLNKDYIRIIKIFKKYNSSTPFVLYTNGILLNPDKAKKLFNIGINYIILDDYNNKKDYFIKLYNEFDLILNYQNEYDIYQDIDINHHKIILNKLNEDNMLNHAGNINSDLNNLDKPLDKLCLRPFRDIAIYYNGDVGLCCEDAGLERKLGNILYETLMQLYNCDKITETRLNLLKNKRINNPCFKCNYKDKEVI